MPRKNFTSSYTCHKRHDHNRKNWLFQNPTPLPPPPRHVQGSWSVSAGLWGARLFILPHIVVGIVAAFFGFFLLLAAIFSSDVPGVITGVTVDQSKKGITYTAHYSYQVGDDVYPDDTDSIDKNLYDRITLGNGFEHNAHPEKERRSPYGTLALAGLADPASEVPRASGSFWAS